MCGMCSIIMVVICVLCCSVGRIFDKVFMLLVEVLMMIVLIVWLFRVGSGMRFIVFFFFGRCDFFVLFY